MTLALALKTCPHQDVSLACRAGTRDFCLALAALVGPVENTSPYTISIHLSPSPSKLGTGQADVLARLSLSILYVSVLHFAPFLIIRFTDPMQANCANPLLPSHL